MDEREYIVEFDVKWVDRSLSERGATVRMRLIWADTESMAIAKGVKRLSELVPNAEIVSAMARIP